MKLTHRSINKFLAVVCLGIGMYLVLAPFVGLPFSSSNDFPSGKKIVEIDTTNIQNLKDQPNYLEFTSGPKIRSEIIEGSNIGVIDNGGLWRVQKSSNNPEQSNMVVVGHNFTYDNTHPPFRDLTQVKGGDTIRLVYNNKLYNYKVTNTAVHSPEDLFVENPSDQPKLTLYTCYPMFMARERFVVTAEQI